MTGVTVTSTSGNAQGLPCFAFPLIDNSSSPDEATLLKVSRATSYIARLWLLVMTTLQPGNPCGPKLAMHSVLH